MNSIVSIVILFSSLLLCLSAAVSESHPDIRGTITEIRPASAEQQSRWLGTVMVEAENKSAKVDKANLIITDKTRILKHEDDKRVQTTFEELKTGQLIEAQFVEGPTIMIYPLQVAASEIVILKSNDGARE